MGIGMNGRLEDFAAQSVNELPRAPQRSRKLVEKSEPYLGGRPPLWWLEQAALLKSFALSAGLCLWFIRAVRKSNAPIRNCAGVRKKLGLNDRQMLRGLRQLEAAGLVRFLEGGRGHRATVDLITTRASQSRSDSRDVE
jgi:hypothetical protein